MRMARFLLPAPLCLLAACATPQSPAPAAAQTALPADFSAAYRPSPGEAELWWRGFGDRELNRLVDRALAQNLDIAATRQRLMAARALLDAERSDRLPQVDGFGEAGADGGFRGNNNDLRAAAGLAGAFNPDINGRLSAEIAQQLARTQGAAYQLADARRLIAASVALTYIELKRSEERLDLLAQSSALQERTLNIVTLRYEAGLSANLDVRRAAADLARTQAQRGLIDLARADALNSLAVLIGEPASTGISLPDDDGGIPEYAGGPPRGVPADLVRRRPDLLVAEANLAAAGAAVGIERADLYPSLVIPGQIGLDALGSVSIVSSIIATLTAVLDIPLIDGGRRRAEVRSAEALAEASLYDYRQLLLQILAEVETSLVAIQSYEERLDALAGAIDQSEVAFNQSNALYREGLTSLFEVLDVQRQLISSRQDYVDAQADLASAIIRMYRAVGAPNMPDTQPITAD